MKRILKKRNLIILAGLLILIVGGWFAYVKITAKPKQYPQVPINKTQDSTTNDTTTPTATANPNVPGGTTGANVDNGAKLIAPSGNFVSSHTLPMSGQAESTCVTTVTATCQIIFTKDNVSKSLPPKQADTSRSDQNGTVTWSVWTPASVGLTPGTWTVSAQATLGSQTQTTVDQVKLTVKP